MSFLSGLIEDAGFFLACFCSPAALTCYLWLAADIHRASGRAAGPLGELLGPGVEVPRCSAEPEGETVGRWGGWGGGPFPALQSEHLHLPAGPPSSLLSRLIGGHGAVLGVSTRDPLGPGRGGLEASRCVQEGKARQLCVLAEACAPPGAPQPT